MPGQKNMRVGNYRAPIDTTGIPASEDFETLSPPADMTKEERAYLNGRGPDAKNSAIRAIYRARQANAPKKGTSNG